MFAQFVPMIGNMMPGVAQFQSVEVQRHQARTLLYREALDELRKNPEVTDIPDCNEGLQRYSTSGCIPLVRGEWALEGEDTGRRVALLIGINSYADPIPPLETPLHDVEVLGGLLKEKFGYEVEIVANGGKKAITEALANLAETTTEKDSVLVMYAGHGYLMDDTGMGYWIPIDASVKTAVNWISNADIAKFLNAIPAHQLILVSDSCFSGSLTKEYRFSSAFKLERGGLARMRAVLAFSSGGEEPVSDEGKEGHSIFAWSLIDALRGLKQAVSGFEIFSLVKSNVMKEYPQEPQYGAVVSARHSVGSDYVLEPLLD